MKNELVSIIVPIYKVERYLKDCVNSIINQTYKNLEIILIDDGSPDNCGKICDEYAKKDNRIKVIHKENGGLSSARNAGLDIATGEYISFIDSDDCVTYNFIEKLYRLCVDNDADIAECDFLKFENAEELKYNKPEMEIIEKYTSAEMQERMYFENSVRTVVVWNKLYKRHLYEKLRFPIGKINEDEFTTYKAFDKTNKKIIVSNDTLYFYRYNSNSIMGRKFNVKRLDALDAYDERKEYYKKKNAEDLYRITVEKYQKMLSEYYLLTKLYVENERIYLDNIYKKATENYKEYKKNNKDSIKEKIKNKLFILFPKMYCFLMIQKRNYSNIGLGEK